jgi:hypothetical protein
MIRIRHNIPLICFFALLISSCKALNESSKHGFNEGFYKSRLFHKKLKRVYVVPGENEIKIYSEKSLHKIDTALAVKIAFPADKKPLDFNEYLFRNSSPDISIISTFLKYRPSVSGFPNQLTTSIFNGAFFFGYRNDIYKLKYTENPLHDFKRNIRHYGFSVGVFAGLGTTPMNEFVTQGNIAIEYDGFENVTGLAAFLTIRKLNFGLTLGIDHLMDTNKDVWIYQGKPWAGLSIGLHLD